MSDEVPLDVRMSFERLVGDWRAAGGQGSCPHFGHTDDRGTWSTEPDGRIAFRGRRTFLRENVKPKPAEPDLGRWLTAVYGTIFASGIVTLIVGVAMSSPKVGGFGGVLALIGFVCGVTVLAIKEL